MVGAISAAESAGKRVERRLAVKWFAEASAQRAAITTVVFVEGAHECTYRSGAFGGSAGSGERCVLPFLPLMHGHIRAHMQVFRCHVGI